MQGNIIQGRARHLVRWSIDMGPDMIHQVILRHGVAIDSQAGGIMKRRTRHAWIERHVIREVLGQIDNEHDQKLLHIYSRRETLQISLSSRAMVIRACITSISRVKPWGATRIIRPRAETTMECWRSASSSRCARSGEPTSRAVVAPLSSGL